MEHHLLAVRTRGVDAQAALYHPVELPAGVTLAEEDLSSDQIDELLGFFVREKIRIVRSAEVETAKSTARPRVASALHDEGSYNFDPVRVYLREMGQVSLLTREGEVAIAKRIEAGLHA